VYFPPNQNVTLVRPRRNLGLKGETQARNGTSRLILGANSALNLRKNNGFAWSDPAVSPAMYTNLPAGALFHSLSVAGGVEKE